MRRRDEVLVGLFTTVAIIILALSSIWLVRGGLNRGYLLHSRFTWGAGIKQGAPVWLVGVTIGTVDKVDLDPRGTLLITYRIQKEHERPDRHGGDDRAERLLRRPGDRVHARGA